MEKRLGILQFTLTILFMCGVTLGCRDARTFNQPSPEQIIQWAGLPSDTHLNVLTNVPTEAIPDDIRTLGKLKWMRTYENRKGRSLQCFVVAIYEPGTLYGTNRANVLDGIEQLSKTNRAAVDLLGVGITNLPNGQKVYGFIFGYDLERFTFHPDFDLLVVESLDSRDDYPPEERIENPPDAVKKFATLFTNLDAFFTP